ncbi:leucyl/phenylalanyl-tRNA--protein transferase [candidate division KSB3 bacterium]|uniref:Leucyl/phenylalanyl-tRNA--protein transferase n=1 Tax=candidate division KSB3 bacterium TaxID=2044937 RepID=A0A2G6KAN4_9BACT|nr:MAG: leucyl/phenylalanyl-tRNA--protein transferase [candidate division KSB3 bacterium]
MKPVYLLTDDIIFPAPELSREDGLLAVGGDLCVPRLLLAYQMGIFPWYSEGDPILWWSPDPRAVLYPDELVVSKSLRKVLRKGLFEITIDTAFEQVIRSCASVPRVGQDGTWIVDEMIGAYCRLHEAGYAHSFETWHKGGLAGGLYGVSVGRCFLGESMFTRKSNASKVALYSLVEYAKDRQFDFIDCQFMTEHLMSLGAREISKRQFLSELKCSLRYPSLQGKWSFATDEKLAAQTQKNV